MIPASLQHQMKEGTHTQFILTLPPHNRLESNLKINKWNIQEVRVTFDDLVVKVNEN